MIILYLLISVVILFLLLLVVILGVNLIDLGSEYISSKSFIRGYTLIIAGLILIMFVLMFILYTF